MTLLDTINYYLDEAEGDMESLSWEIREETNYEDCNLDSLTELYDFHKENYENLQKIKKMIVEKDPIQQILNDPNDNLNERIISSLQEAVELWSEK